MNRYKIKAGIHNEDGVTYGKNEEAGDIVTSPYNLVAMFPEKFEDLGPEKGSVLPQEEPEDEEEEETETKVTHRTKPSSTSTKKTTAKRSHHKRTGAWE